MGDSKSIQTLSAEREWREYAEIESMSINLAHEVAHTYCNDYSEIVLVKWPFLVKYSIYPEQQQAFSQAFADYFWEQVAKE